MNRGPAVALALVVWIGTADAGPKRKVRIDTSPEGATVYVGDKENGTNCEATPCSIDLPIGESSLIIELAGYDPKFHSVVVPKRGAIKVESLTLSKALGTLIIEEPVGGKVTIDDEDSGTIPLELEISAGSHTIIVTHKGKTSAALFVDLASGEGKTVEPSFDDATSDTKPSDEDPERPEGGEIVKQAPAAARAPFVSLGVNGEVGFRSFTYEGDMSNPPLRGETENGGFVVGPQIEVWPGIALKIRPLRGLSIMGRWLFPGNHLQVEGDGVGATQPLETFWQMIEVSARNKFRIGEAMGLEIGAGYVRDQYQYNGTPTDKRVVPDALYSAVRIGARFSYAAVLSPALRVEPFIGGEFRLVRDGGALQGRFGTGTGASGMKGSLGAVGHYKSVFLRAELGLLRYAWDFTPKNDFIATGGTDSIKQLGFSLGYAY